MLLWHYVILSGNEFPNVRELLCKVLKFLYENVTFLQHSGYKIFTFMLQSAKAARLIAGPNSPPGQSKLQIKTI